MASSLVIAHLCVPFLLALCRRKGNGMAGDTVKVDNSGNFLLLLMGGGHALLVLTCFQPLEWRVGGDRPWGQDSPCLQLLFKMQFSVAFGWFCS